MKSKLLMVSMKVKREHRILRWAGGALGLAMLAFAAHNWLWRNPPPSPAAPNPYGAAHSHAEFVAASGHGIPDQITASPRPPQAAIAASESSQDDAPMDDAQVAEMAYTYPALLLDLTGAAPAIENGRFVGIRVAPNADATLLAKLGLEPGDILIAVNGVSIESVEQSIVLLGRLSGIGRLTFTVRRGDNVLVAG